MIILLILVTFFSNESKDYQIIWELRIILYTSELQYLTRSFLLLSLLLFYFH